MRRSRVISNNIRRLSNTDSLRPGLVRTHPICCLLAPTNFGETTTTWPQQRPSPATIVRCYQTHSSAQFQESGESGEPVGSEALRANFQRHQKFVEERHETTLPNPHRIRNAILFLQSKNANQYAFRNNMTNVPKQLLKRLVEYLEYQNETNPQARGRWMHQCVTVAGLRYMEPMIRAIKFFLRPFGGTAFAIRRWGTRTHRRKDVLPEEALEALQYATKVYTIMTKLVRDPHQSPTILRAALYVWKDRCTYFGNMNFTKVPLSPDMVQKAFGGMQGAEACLDEMDRLVRQAEEICNPLDREAAYGTYVSALAVSGTKGAASRARQVLQTFEDKHKASNTTIYNCVMQAYANEAKFDSTVVRDALKLWDHICSLEHLGPSAATFNSMLMAFSNAQLPEEAEELLLLQEQNSQKLGLVPTRTEYNVVINAWAKSLLPGSSDRALSLFHSMVSKTQDRTDVSPDAITYTILIDALARNHNTGERGLQLAEQLLQECESGNDAKVQANHTMYQTYLRALAGRLRRQNSSFARVQVVERMESLLFRMKGMAAKVHPSMARHWHNASIYGHVIEAWTVTRAKEAPSRALKLYSMLKEENQREQDSSNLVPDLELYHYLLTCMGGRGGTAAGDPGLAHHVVSVAKSLLNDIQELGYPLTTTTLNLYLRVLSTRRVKEALEEAEGQLEALEASYAKGISAVVPNGTSYQVVMEGYGKLRGGAEPAERLLNQMIALAEKYSERKAVLKPPSACYTIVMDAWSRSERADSVENVERILGEAKKRGIHPTTHMYTTLINSYAHSDQIVDAPERAKAILVNMKSDFESGKNSECEPTIATFSALLKCWEMSGRRDAPDEIEAIIRHLHELHYHNQHSKLTLNFPCFRVALSAWASSGRADAGERAAALLSLAREYCNAGKIESYQLQNCYLLALVAISKSHDTGKAVKASSLLEKVREEGRKPRMQELEQVLRTCEEAGALDEATEEARGV